MLLYAYAVVKKNDGRLLWLLNFYDFIAYNRNRFIGRNLSGSYAIQPGDAGYESFINELNELFDRFSSQGQMIVPHKTVAYWGAVE